MTTLLQQWEEQFKKGQVTLWVLTALVDGDKSVEEIVEFTEHLSGGAYAFDPQSVYRAMRNFTNLKLVEYKSASSDKGPNKKIFSITTLGKELLKNFYIRNLKIFNTKEFNLLIKKLDEN